MLASIYGHAFFAHNSVIFGPISNIFIWLCSGDQELSIEYPGDYFWAKNKNAKFSAHIWAWVWRVAHLAQRCKKFAKSFPQGWGISINSYLKNYYPKQKSTTPPP